MINSIRTFALFLLISSLPLYQVNFKERLNKKMSNWSSQTGSFTPRLRNLCFFLKPVIKAGEGYQRVILKYLVFLRKINFSYQPKGEDRIRILTS